MFRHAWDQRGAQINYIQNALHQALEDVEKKEEALVKRIVSADSDALVKAYEKHLKSLDSEKLRIASKLKKSDKSAYRFEDIIEPGIKFLENPWNLWASGEISLRRLVLRLAFADPMIYDRNKGYRTEKPHYLSGT